MGRVGFRGKVDSEASCAVWEPSGNSMLAGALPRSGRRLMARVWKRGGFDDGMADGVAMVAVGCRAGGERVLRGVWQRTAASRRAA